MDHAAGCVFRVRVLAAGRESLGPKARGLHRKQKDGPQKWQALCRLPSEEQMIENIFRAVVAGRTALNLSQHQLAELSGLHKSTIIKIESGDLVVKLRSINALFDVFKKYGLEFAISNNYMTFKLNFKEDKNVRQH